ncbi:MAG: lytic transglycosylase domain-containing protein [Lachnospiraceae bacterium]|nr:lytic transglycosylase domain-containing protein [Lachnospiraceae bacterium]
MKITIETDDKNVYTDFVSPKEVSSSNATSETTSATSETDASSSVSDEFSSMLNTAVDNIASSKSSESSQTTTSMTLTEIFQKASETYGVDVELLKAVAQKESGFDASATSSSGAMGIMQLMPSTAEGLGVTDAYDPYQNIMGGAKLLSDLLKKYNNDTSLALAAYNAGSGNVDKYGGIPPFAETQNYVPKVLEYYAQGVTIPADKDISASGSTDYTATANTLKEALSEFSNHESYEYFLKELENELNVESSDSATAYESLMSAASRAITTTINNYK